MSVVNLFSQTVSQFIIVIFLKKWTISKSGLIKKKKKKMKETSAYNFRMRRTHHVMMPELAKNDDKEC